MIPAGHALRVALALKLWSIERKSHIMALVADDGLALFCGLNAMPKKSFLPEYSSRITPPKVSRLLALWHGQLTGEALLTGLSLNLDFHSVPYFGEHPLVQSHYLSKRSRRQPSILTFLAQDGRPDDAGSEVFCYSNADIRKGDEAEEVFRFVDFWKRQYGRLPAHLVFDSKLTTYDRPAMPSACSSRTHCPTRCASSISMRCLHRSASRSTSTWHCSSSPQASIA